MLERILIVDDDALVLETLAEVLTSAGFQVSPAASAQRALELLAQAPHALLLSDIRLPGIDGMELLAEVRRVHPGTDVVLMTGYGSLDGAIEAMLLGAADYLTKPLKPKEVVARVRSVLQRQRLEVELHSLQSELRSRYDMHNLVAASPRMTAVVAAVQRVRDTSEPVVLFGERGSGRRFIARSIHSSGARRMNEFQLLDVRVQPAESIEAALFGARSDGGRLRRGLLERTVGTLHIAGIAELERDVQRRLAREIELQFAAAREADRAPPCRLILSTEEPSTELAANGRLVDELEVLRKLVTIHVPPLRHRIDDIPGLVAVFLEEYAREQGRSLRVGPRVVELLASHDFPGNVRQLFAVLSHCATLSVDGVLALENLERSLRQSDLGPERGIADHLGDREYQLVLLAVQRNPGRLDQAARELGVSRTTLWRRMRKYGIRLAAL